jgi:adenylate cyclase
VSASSGIDVRDDQLARELIRSRQERGSRAIARAALVVCALASPFVVYVSVLVNPRLGLALGGVVGFFVAYQLGMLAVFRRGLYRPWIDWWNGSFEICLGMGVIVIDAELQGPAYAFSSAPALLFPVTVLMSAVRLRRALSIYTGVLAGVLYLAIYIAYRSQLDPDLVAALPSLETWNIVQRSCFFAFSGFVAFLVCQLMRRSVVELLASARQKLLVERTLGRHVSREVADLLVASDSDWLAEERDLTVLFSDIRSFTSFSEERAPGEVVAFLNDYFSVAARAVESNGGIVNKFTGDGFMALFGAPVAADDHADRAARAALQMLDELAGLADRWGDLRGRVGVGIHTGSAVVGTVGTESRAEYTAIGDTVNLAARLEQLTKELDGEILVSDETARRLSDDLAVERLSEVAVRGRSEPIVVHRLSRDGGASHTLRHSTRA